MNKNQRQFAFALFSFLLISAITIPSFAQETTKPIIALESPSDTEILVETQQTVVISYQDDSGINTDSITLIVDDFDVTDWEETTITETETRYKTSEIFPWKNGNHTVEFIIEDTEGNRANQTWQFTVDTAMKGRIDPMLILSYILIATAIAFIAVGIYILYLKITKGFTFEKFFAQHPIKTEIFTIYLPVIAGFLFILLTLTVFKDLISLPPYGTEYVFVIGIFIAIIPYAIDSQLRRKKITKYEQAFSQFLFELADAMRGGLDPTKAIIELSTTEAGILKNHLQSAADNIKLGRPFDEVMQAMAKPIKSDLIQRYAGLIGDTSKIGGEPAQVIHRAAKDMDDFIKIGEERRRQLLSQASIIYIAFAVMLIVIYQLMNMASQLTGFDLSQIESELIQLDLSSTPKMPMHIMKQRFFDLLIINSLGTGTIIGSFIDGHFKYGLVHSVILTTISVLFFVIMIL